MDRRDFLLKGSVAVGGAVFAGSLLGDDSGGKADLILRGGPILTMEEALPMATAMAVKGDRILAVGSDESVVSHRGDRTRIVDLNGASVTPGLVDAHSHVMAFGQIRMLFLQLWQDEVASFVDLQHKLAERAKGTPPGEWIVGRGFNRFKEGRYPTREELDVATSRHPVLIINWSGQFGVANTLGLREAGLLSADTDDPYGGKYLRGRDGVPDGRLLHYPAIYGVHQPVMDAREQVECTRWALRKFAESGVTCITDNFCHPRYAATYVRMERMGQLTARIRVYPYVRNLEQCRAVIQRVARYRGPLVRMQGVKLAADGYMMMREIPREHRHLAIPMHPQRILEQMVSEIHQAGMQADIHAVGDKAVDWSVEAFVKAAGSKAACRNARHRIEHFAFRRRDTIRRAAEYGIPVCTQPMFVDMKADDMRGKLGRDGPKLVGRMIPSKTFLEEGVMLAYGADVPAFPHHEAMASIASAMERKTGEGIVLDSRESLTFAEALRVHTIGSTHAAFDEDEMGSLKSGKLADFVIWPGDLREIKTAEQARALRPLATFLGGKEVYRVSG